jgi:hypothetical protein
MLGEKVLATLQVIQQIERLAPFGSSMIVEVYLVVVAQ